MLWLVAVKGWLMAPFVEQYQNHNGSGPRCHAELSMTGIHKNALSWGLSRRQITLSIK